MKLRDAEIQSHPDKELTKPLSNLRGEKQTNPSDAEEMKSYQISYMRGDMVMPSCNHLQGDPEILTYGDISPT